MTIEFEDFAEETVVPSAHFRVGRCDRCGRFASVLFPKYIRGEPEEMLGSCCHERRSE